MRVVGPLRERAIKIVYRFRGRNLVHQILEFSLDLSLLLFLVSTGFSRFLLFSAWFTGRFHFYVLIGLVRSLHFDVLFIFTHLNIYNFKW